MLKPIVALGVPGLLGGVGLFYDGQNTSVGREPQLGAYLVEVGVVFPEAAVRAALPEGLDPAPGFTGGIAIHGGQESRTPSALATGHIWIDVESSGSLARYTLKHFVSEVYEDTSTAALDVAARSGAPELSEDGVLHVLAWPDQVSGVELVVRAASESCSLGPAVGGELPTFGSGEGLSAVPMPAVAGWCKVEAEAALARVRAPSGHVLRPFVPQQVLWAEIATPQGEGMLQLATE